MRTLTSKIPPIAYKIYMDVCCLNCPFDDLDQERIRLEAEAIVTIINRCQKKQWELVNGT